MLLLVRIAWRNLWRHRRRTLITAVAMAVGVALVMASDAITVGLYDELFRVMVEQRLGHVQVHHPRYPSSRSLHDAVREAAAVQAAIDATEGTVAAAPRVFGFALVGTETRSEGAMLVGVDPTRERAVGRIEERIPRGRFLGPAPAAEVTVGRELAEDLEIDVGATLVAVTQSADGSLGNALYTVVGIHRTGDVQLDRMGVYLHLADAQELLALGDRVHGFTVLTTDPERLDPYAERLRAALGDRASASWSEPGSPTGSPTESAASATGSAPGSPTGSASGSPTGSAAAAPPDAIEVQTWSEASPESAKMMGMSDFASFISLGIVFGAAAFGILNTMMMSVFERTRELGVLVAVGLKPWRMVSMILAESVLLAALAVGIGLVLGGALDAYLVRYGLEWAVAEDEGFSFAGVILDPVVKGRVELAGVVRIVVAVFVVSLGASVWPAVRAARLRPVDAMRAE